MRMKVYSLFAFFVFVCTIQVTSAGNGCDKGEAYGWTQWSTCTASCSGGTRARVCICVDSDVSTATCTPGDNEIEGCNENDCPGDDDDNAESVVAAIIILLLIILKWFPFLLG